MSTRISSSSTLIDNIFCNLTSRVSDHLPQFLILLEFSSNAPRSKYNIYTHDSKKFDEEKSIFEFNSEDWDKENANKTIDNYLQNLNNLLEKYAPLKTLNKKERKFEQKP